MADIFDIANLITTVGVEAVKIKQEPGLPEKSSKEILTELFSTFDADEGIASPVNEENLRSDDDDEAKSIRGKKKKKSKKKHKHKDKKHRKKGKRNTSESDSDEDVAAKKKKKHKKKSKSKQSSHSSEESNSEAAPAAKRRKTEVTPAIKCKVEADDAAKLLVSSNRKIIADNIANDFDAKTSSAENKDPGSPVLPSILRKVRDDDDEDDEANGPGIPRFLEKSKQQTQGKILIKDLRNSAVYNETVKKIQTKEKEKAARMEDGEISDSGSYNRTPTLSPSPSGNRDLPIDSPLTSPLSSRRKRTPSPGSVGIIRTDLRLVLKEKEKKKFGSARRSEGRDVREARKKTSRDRRSDRDAKRRTSEHERRSRSRDRKNGDSSKRSSLRRSGSGGRCETRRRSNERRERSDERCIGSSRERRKYSREDNDGDRDRSEDKHRDKHGRARSRSKERKDRIEIDKKKLLEIARRNAISMIKQGALPLAQQDKAIAAIQAGGKSVDELTDFCKSLSKSEALGELSSISSDDDGNNSQKGFHHPFILRERPTSIIMNIKDARQLPNKTFQEKTAESSTQLTLKFPVSSGQHHRKTESEWIPVIPKKPEPKKTFVPATVKPAHQTFSIAPPISAPLPVPAPVPAPAPVSLTQQQIIAVPQTPVFPQAPTMEPVDIGSIVSQRLAAMRRLRENPHDVEALSEMYHAQNGMKNWAESKQVPGQFTGSTSVKVLSPAELHSGYQAWARKDQLVTAAPVSGGMGMALLQKMGWRPGEGLGKNKEGTLVPLQLEVKLDKRGLVTDQDIGQKSGKTQKPAVPMIKTLEGKHPVSLLGEYCSKRKFGAPVYELCFECGPDHKKNFLFKVKVNGIEYKPTVASPNKKQAKAEAAQICLQTLGLLQT